MKILLSWLRDYVDYTGSVDELAHRLTMCGLEVEAIERLNNDDAILDINITPNRADCLSLVGIAREVAALYSGELRFPEHDFVSETGELDFNLDILNTELCHRYAGRIVKDVRIAPSPEWMQKRLQLCGIRVINNVVDITNYVMLELGHPLHAFDLHRLRGKRIIVATAGQVKWDDDQMKMRLLDGTERTLSEEMLLINDGERPVALAGVMGGEDSEVTGSTKDLFVESAWFAPSSIRKTSAKLGLKTESAYRFERGADIKLLKKALDRTSFLLRDIAGGKICGKIDLYPKRYTPCHIKVSFEKINSFLGMDVPRRDVIRILSSLGFKIDASGGDITVTPPSGRLDVSRDVDIIEEVVRIYGYEKVPSSTPKLPIHSKKDNRAYKLLMQRLSKDCASLLQADGFYEALNYSFMGPQDLDILDIAESDSRRQAINILNPLRKEDSMMRTTLVPSLIRNLVHNISYGNKNIRLFEVSKVFVKTASDTETLPCEQRHLALLMVIDKEKKLYSDNTEGFFVLKGIIERLLDLTGIEDTVFVRSAEPFLHKGRSADIMIKKAPSPCSSIKSNEDTILRLGFLGALSSSVIERLSVRTSKQDIFVAELCLEGMAALSKGASGKGIRFKSLPQFPYIERDSAVIVDDALEAGHFMDMVRAFMSPLIEEVNLFDIYKGKGIPEGKKSIAFSVRYRSPEKTLSDQEAETVHQYLLKEILSKTRGVLRDR